MTFTSDLFFLNAFSGLRFLAQTRNYYNRLSQVYTIAGSSVPEATFVTRKQRKEFPKNKISLLQSVKIFAQIFHRSLIPTPPFPGRTQHAQAAVTSHLFMMAVKWAKAAILSALLVPCIAAAQKIKTGYDKSADFSGYKTYAWTQPQPSPIQPLVATIIVADIDHELSARGLRKVEKDPDLLVAYYAGGNVQSAFAHTDPGYLSTGGIPPPNATMWTGSLPATAMPQVVKGRLIVDLADARKQQLVWRASAQAKIDYEKRSKIYDTVNKVIPKMFEKYPPSEAGKQ